MFKWFTNFFKEKSQEIPKTITLGCISQTILNDIKNEPHEYWSHKIVGHVYPSHEYTSPNGKYSLRCRFSSDFYKNVSLLNVHINPLTGQEQEAIWCALKDLQERKNNAEYEVKKKRDEKILSEMFPHCYIKRSPLRKPAVDKNFYE